MSTPISVVDLWNELVGLGRDDGAHLGRINAELERLAAEVPKDFLTRLAAAEGLRMAGNVAKGARHLEAAWGLRQKQHYADMLNLLSALVQYAAFGRAYDLYNQIRQIPEADEDAILGDIGTVLALRMGRADLLRRIVEVERQPSRIGRDALRILTEANLDGHYSDHQRVVESVVVRGACGFVAEIVTDETAPPKLFLHYWTSMTARQQFDMLRRMHEALREVYAEHPAGPCAYVGRIGMMVSGPEVVSMEEAA